MTVLSHHILEVWDFLKRDPKPNASLIGILSSEMNPSEKVQDYERLHQASRSRELSWGIHTPSFFCLWQHFSLLNPQGHFHFALFL